jgi:hypothetical protein
MSSTTTPTKKHAPEPGLVRMSKTDQQTVQRDAGAYYLMVEAIMQNGRLAGEIAHRWLEAKGYLIVSKAEADRENLRLHPELRAVIEKADAEVKAAQAEIAELKNRLMDLVR